MTVPLMMLVDAKGNVVNDNIHVAELDAELNKLLAKPEGDANASRQHPIRSVSSGGWESSASVHAMYAPGQRTCQDYGNVEADLPTPAAVAPGTDSATWTMTPSSSNAPSVGMERSLAAVSFGLLLLPNRVRFGFDVFQLVLKFLPAIFHYFSPHELHVHQQVPRSSNVSG